MQRVQIWYRRLLKSHKIWWDSPFKHKQFNNDFSLLSNKRYRIKMSFKRLNIYGTLTLERFKIENTCQNKFQFGKVKDYFVLYFYLPKMR